MWRILYRSFALRASACYGFAEKLRFGLALSFYGESDRHDCRIDRSAIDRQMAELRDHFQIRRTIDELGYGKKRIKELFP